MNRLQFETSPYLLQHAHNPVHWYAWKPEAFERAAKEGKPILVSIGYSTCHWCHVMERESFEDPAVAEFMNRHFINIKVDREERPDVDHIYMEACQAINGSGGWPLNCFLTPDGRPFYAGTYYPPRPAHNRPSWPQLLQHLIHLFTTQRETVEGQADRLTKLIGNSEKVFLSAIQPEQPSGGFHPVMLSNIFHTLKQNFDTRYGGFGGAPKFPGVMALRFLLEYHFHTGDPQALEHVEFSMKKMIGGGIYDQLGGGFARYTTDQAWLVPHFEKMLYDNALLVGLLADLYRWNKDPLYATAIEETLQFIQREMTSPEGGFFSALDADSEGKEGKFYVWTWEELEEVLGQDADLVAPFFGASPGGNWEGANILWRPVLLEEYVQEKGLEEDRFRTLLDSARQRLMQRRCKRIRPGLDNKILLDWNALMCSAYARAYQALGHSQYRDAAERNLNFLLSRFQKPEGSGLYHTYSITEEGGRAQYDAFLDDYANLIEALLEVYSITFNPHYLKLATGYAEFVISEFFDPETNLFYFTASSQGDLVMRKKELFDNSTPAGNSTMVSNFLRLGALLGIPPYSERAHAMLSGLRESIERYPSSFARWANAVLRLVYPGFEVAITGPEAAPFAMEINQHFFPNKEIMAAENALAEFRLLAGREVKGKTLIYVCQDFACQLPVESPGEALNMLAPSWKKPI